MRNSTAASPALRQLPRRAALRSTLQVVLVLALAVPACSPPGARRSDSAADRNVITRAQINERHFSTAYDAVETLRSNWMLTRGPDSLGNPSVVQVYLDLTRMGGVEQLRNISATSISYIRYYDGIAATARWGLDHGSGAILVSTHP